jgi:orotidine-5'-phosphate decarboxylase
MSVTSSSKPDPKIIVALDYAEAAPALKLADRLDPALCRLKVGKELFTAEGPALVTPLVNQGYGVFLDLKFHDIPNTVAKACAAAARLGVWMLNVHALGGQKMMEAARDAIDQSTNRPYLIAVTILTSSDAATLSSIGIQTDIENTVLNLAILAKQSGLDGVVCSAQETAMLKQKIGVDFCLVTPGIRPADANADDQVRIVTPANAIKNGSSYLVIGRPITQAADPLAALQSINKEIQALI